MQNPNIPNLTINIIPVKEGQQYEIVEFHGDLDKAGLGLISGSDTGIGINLNTLVENFPYNNLIFDFRDLNFINSEGIGFLMTIHSHLTKRNKNLSLLGAKDHVKDVLNVIGILNVLKTFNSIEEFIENNQ